MPDAPLAATPMLAAAPSGAGSAGGNRPFATGMSALPPAVSRTSGPPDAGASDDSQQWWGTGARAQPHAPEVTAARPAPQLAAVPGPLGTTPRSPGTVPGPLGTTPAPWVSSMPARAGNGPNGPIPSAAARPPRPSAVDLPFTLPPGVGPRLVVIGAIAGAVAVFLPWASGPTGVVIGGDIGLSYFAQWGLASPGNLLPLAATVLVLALALMPGRVPAWLAYGVLPLLDGGVLFGIAWTYLTSKYGVGLGIDALAVASALLAAGAILVLRHEEERRNVT